jgi:hypothetical protein
MSGSACASALEYRPAATSACRASNTGPQYSRRRASSCAAAEPTGFSEPPDCVSGDLLRSLVFIRQWPAVAEPARSEKRARGGASAEASALCKQCFL